MNSNFGHIPHRVSLVSWLVFHEQVGDTVNQEHNFKEVVEIVNRLIEIRMKSKCGYVRVHVAGDQAKNCYE